MSYKAYIIFNDFFKILKNLNFVHITEFVKVRYFPNLHFVVHYSDN